MYRTFSPPIRDRRFQRINDMGDWIRLRTDVRIDFAQRMLIDKHFRSVCIVSFAFFP